MKYAYVIDGIVTEIFETLIAEVDMMGPDETGALVVLVPAGQEVPLSMRFHPDFVARFREIPEGETVEPGYSYDGSTFAPPPPPPPPTAEQVRAMRDGLRVTADAAIAPLQDALDLDEITPAEQALLTKWKKYRVDLSRIEQQGGFPASVVWPTPPQ